MHAEVELMAARATGQSEPGPAVCVGLVVWDDGKVPRVPFIGAHAGAIEGTTPHRNVRLDRWSACRPSTSPAIDGDADGIEAGRS